MSERYTDGFENVGTNAKRPRRILIDDELDAIDAVDSPIGFMPKAEDINLEELEFSIDRLKSILDSDKSVWAEEAKEIENFYTTKFGETLPKELYKQLADLKERLK